MKFRKKIIKLLNEFLNEDIGTGDVTTDSTAPADLKIHGEFIAKQKGIIAGLEVIKLLFSLIDKASKVQSNIRDGDSVLAGHIIATITGSARGILKGERTALNILQRMSGIATLTNQYVNAVKGTLAVILDTRKTAPGLRIFDKWAVSIGGGQNHRFGLYDMILIKENHINIAGSITHAVQRVRHKYNNRYFVEVEVRNLDELEEAIGLKPDRIMLDNMSISQLEEAVRMNNGQIPLEASGNINLGNIRKIAEAGVNYISIGSITHSVQALDISLILEEKINFYQKK